LDAKSVDELEQPEQIAKTAEIVASAYRGRLDGELFLPIRPELRNQRTAAVGQNRKKIVDAPSPDGADHGQRAILESMTLAGDRHRSRNIMAMGESVAVSFDSIDHGHLRRFLDQRLTDGVVRRMIDKWLKAGVLEKGMLRRTTGGTPQGGVVTP
jgi:hypothetical protein